MPNLSCYLLREPPAEHANDLRWFLEPTNAPDLREYSPSLPGLTAALFISESAPRPPIWAAFLREGFPELVISNNGSVRALLIVASPKPGGRSLAFAFGTGRYLLKQDVWVRGFGLRAALNVVCGDEDSELVPQIRSIDAKRLQSTVLRRRHQSSNSVPMETLDIDVARDLLRTVHGTPADSDSWGSRIGGAHALHFPLAADFAALPAVRDRVLALAASTRYKSRFPFVDYMSPVEEPAARIAVQEQVVALLAKASVDDFGFSPPDIVDWDSVEGFRFSFDHRKNPVDRPDLDASFLVAALKERGKLSGLAPENLQNWTVIPVDADGHVSGPRWTIWECLSASLDLDGHLYVLDDGEIYEVDAAYLKGIDAYLDGVAGWQQHGVPDARPKESETAYIARLCETDDELVNIHETDQITIPTETYPVELCDVFHATRKELVHLKRSFSSKALSHLLMQGNTSASLLTGSQAFRGAVEVRAVPGLVTTQYQPDNYCVVFGIIGRWRGKPPSKRLPFFSKVSAHSTLQALEAMGYSVAFAQIDVH